MNGVQGARQIGRIRPERGRWETFTDWARAQGEIILRPLVGVLARWNVHPNTVTILGFLLQAGIGVVFGLGRLRLGGILLLAIAPVDALDGALARAVGRKSRFGAFLDSTLDRLSDAALILGLTAHFIREGDHTLVALLLIALVASLLVSYVRARAEALGFTCKAGVITRLERVLIIGAFSALGQPLVMAWALAVLSVLTVGQRIAAIYVQSRREDG
jgi:CDP-diacylglycerol--glycerol-3-phosphate 3-phosphatidyltransferase